MAKQNTIQTVGNYYPDALAVFITLDEEGKPIRDLSTAHTIVPDVDDITDIQLTLGSTGRTGQFVLKINNTRNKYFYADDIEKDIENMKEGKTVTWIALTDPAFSTLKTVAPNATWQNVRDYLNDKAWNHLYAPPVSDDSKIYILFQDSSVNYTDAQLETIEDIELRKDLAKGKLRYRSINKKEISSYNQQSDTASTSITRTDGEEVVSLDDINEAATILSRARRQSSFFEEFGGRISTNAILCNTNAETFPRGKRSKRHDSCIYRIC